jgi:AcrR family transcriptional regulator
VYLKQSKTTDKRQTVFDAAVDLIAEKGYSCVEIPDIAKAAGVTVAVVNKAFKGKAELAAAIVAEYRNRYYGSIFSDEVGRKAGEERVKVVVRNMVELYRRNTALCVAAMAIGDTDIVSVQMADVRDSAKSRDKLNAYFEMLGRDTRDPAEMAVSRGLLTIIVGTHFGTRFMREHRLKRSGPKIDKALKELMHEPECKFDDAFYERYCDALVRFYLYGMTGMAKKTEKGDAESAADFWSFGLF